MFKKIGGFFCILALAAFISAAIAEAASNSSNASNNAAGATKVVPKAKVKQLKEKK